MDQLDLGVTLRSFSPNQKVFNRFVLQRILGRGGMGVVWLARDGELERSVALKFLPEIVALDPVSIAELKRETRRNLDLTHPHIVRIYDFVQDARSAAISMEYVDGPSLSSLRAERPRGVFALADIERWMAQLGEGLAYAHERAQVVHRDLKPANLMLTGAGDLKITDFGIATSISDSVSRVSGRSTSGTAAYMSPQQMMGDRASVTDDIYALGATLYELLTGRPPFHAGNIIAQVTGKVPPSIAERRAEFGITDAEPVPAAWEAAIARCLAKDPKDRPPSVRSLLDELAGKTPRPAAVAMPASAGPADPAAAAATPPATRTAAPGSPAESPAPRRTPLSLYAGAAAILAVVAGAVFFLRPKPAAEAPRPDAPVARPVEAVPKEPVQPGPAVPNPGPAEPARESASPIGKQPALPEVPAITTGSLLVTSEPDDAEVTLGATTRRTPTQFQEVPAGRVTLTFAKPGYESRSLEVNLRAGESLHVPAVKLAALTYPVELSATTPGVTYRLDVAGQVLEGTLPASLRLPAGRHAVRYVRPGYGERSAAVAVTERGAREEADLRGGTLRLESTPPGATVRLAGRPVGTTPLQLTDLAPGANSYELSLAEHLPRTVAITTELGATTDETVALEPDPQVTYLKAIHGHWAAGLNGLRVTDTSGQVTYRAGANFVGGRNYPMKLVKFDAVTQTGTFRADEPKLPAFEIVLRGGSPVLRWQANGRGKYYDVPFGRCTEEYFNKL